MTKTRSQCPIVKTLDIVGDKWSLVVIRDMLAGKSRFKEFLGSPEGITTNILTDRLRRLEASHFLTKAAYQEHPMRYEYKLSALGRSLHPVLKAICLWANEQYPETLKPPKEFLRDLTK